MDQLVIAGKAYASRLLVGTGKYRDFEQTRAAVEASGAQIVTVAIRRTNIGQNAERAEPARRAAARRSTPILPNTAGLLHGRRTRCARCAWRANCWTVTRWSSWKCWAIRIRSIPNVVETLSRRARRW